MGNPIPNSPENIHTDGIIYRLKRLYSCAYEFIQINFYDIYLFQNNYLLYISLYTYI